MKIKLNLKDRFVIGELLPKTGNKLTMIIVYDVIKKLDITQQDIIEFDIKVDGNGYKWNPQKDTEKEFELTEAELKVILDGIAELDKNNGINLDMITTIKKLLSYEVH
ncbi:MAG: hypothetical protein ACPL2D_10570 [Ignavibacteria bacterium]